MMTQHRCETSVVLVAYGDRGSEFVTMLVYTFTHGMQSKFQTYVQPFQFLVFSRDFVNNFISFHHTMRRTVLAFYI